VKPVGDHEFRKRKASTQIHVSNDRHSVNSTTFSSCAQPKCHTIHRTGQIAPHRTNPLGSRRSVANGAVTKHQVRYNCDDRQLKKYQNPNDEIDDINRWCPPPPFVARTKRSRCDATNSLYESRFRTVASCRRHRSNPLNGDGDFH